MDQDKLPDNSNQDAVNPMKELVTIVFGKLENKKIVWVPDR